jgi:hypothetical protein
MPPARIFHAGFQPAWPAARMEYAAPAYAITKTVLEVSIQSSIERAYFE